MQFLRSMAFRIVAAVVVVALVGWRIAASSGGDVAIPTADVQHGDLTLLLTETGELKATRSATVSAPNDKLIIYLAPEGSWVKAGDLLVQLESEKWLWRWSTFRSAMRSASTAASTKYAT